MHVCNSGLQLSIYAYISDTRSMTTDELCKQSGGHAKSTSTGTLSKVRRDEHLGLEVQNQMSNKQHF